jgi:hypothetical protein
VLAFATLGLAAVSLAWGADCGEGVALCHCGDRVVTSTTLNGSHPVLKTPCPCDGLMVESGVRLTIAGTIRGQDGNACAGIRVVPGASGVGVQIGKIVGFDVGVDANGSSGVTWSRFSRLHVVNSGTWGMLVTGDDNVIEQNVVSGPDFFAGIDVFGARNTVSLNRTEGGGLFGIVAGGHGNVVSRNHALRGEFTGVMIYGAQATAEGNQSAYNGGDAFLIAGDDHVVAQNVGHQNGLNGFTVFATLSAFDRNRSDYNGRPADGIGILDFTAGGGTGGTANTYTANRCTGNGLGDSSPLDLCF